MNPPTRGSSPQYVRLSNRKAIMNILRGGRAMPVSGIAAAVRLSKTTVAKIITGLMEQGIVVSSGKGNSTEEGGKKPELYMLNARYRYGMVLGLSDDTATCSVFDLSAELVARRTAPLPPRLSYREMLHIAGGLYREILLESGIGGERLMGVACFTGGIADSENGVFRFPIQYQHWGRDIPLAEGLRRELGLEAPVVLDSAVRFSAYAELASMEEKPDTFVVLFTNALVAGLGGCVIQQGDILRGGGGFIGEFGHMVVEPGSGRRCACGNFGCMEMAVAPETILEHLRDLAGEYPDSPLAVKAAAGDMAAVRELHRAADGGDALARRVAARVADRYTLCIRNIIVSHDPQEIILQGMPLHEDSYFLELLRRQVGLIPFFGLAQSIRIRPSRLGGSPFGLFHKGAALYLCNEFFRKLKP